MTYLVFTFIAVVGLLVLFIAGSYLISVIGGAQFVRSSSDLYPEIIELAQLTPGDRFVELGSGDGSLLKYVAKRTGAHAHGVELSPYLVLRTRLLIRRPDVTVELGNLFSADLRKADCVYTYLLPPMMKRLAKKFSHELKPGSRVVSHAFPIPGKEPSQVISRSHRHGGLYLYEY